MTVQSTTSRADYTGNGVTTLFTVPFYFLNSAHLQVLQTDNSASPATVTTLVLNSDYTVAGAGVPAGGSITMVTAPSAQKTLSILRSVPLTQLTHYVPNDPFPASSHERALDQLAMQVQQLDERADRAITLPANVTGIDTELPAPQANAMLGWNEDADALQNVDPGTLATIVAYGTAKADLFSGTGAQTAFTLTANPGAQANLDVAISGVTQRPGADYTWSAGTTLTFTTAPPLGTSNVLVRYQQGLPQGYTDSAAASYNQGGAGAVQRLVQGRLRESVSLLDKGADSTGAADTATAVTALLADSAGEQRIPAGTFKVDSVVTPAGRDVAISIDPAAAFTGAGRLRFDNLVTYAHSNSWMQRLVRKTFGAAYNAFYDAFLLAAVGIATGTARVTAVYGRGNASASGARAWGGNLCAAADADGGIAIGLEVDPQIIGAGNTAARAYGIVVANSGDLPCENAIQINSNNAVSQFKDGIRFDWDATNGGVTQNLFRCAGAVGATVQRFVYFSGISASLAELDLPSFVVQATQPLTVNRISIRGGPTGTAARMEPDTGSDTNVAVDIRGKGTAGVNLQSGDATNKIRVSNTGIGFYATAPQAKQTVTGSRGGNAALADLLTRLATLGLITDSTTA